MSARLLGVVLCGGRSHRMGRNKSDLPHECGGTFLQHAASRLEKLCEAIALSGNTVSHQYSVIADPVFHGGPVVGIAASLQYAKTNGFDACLFTPVDTPDLTTDDLDSLRSSWLVHRKTTVAESDRIEPLIGIYSAADLELLEQLSTGDDRSLDRFLRSGKISYQTVSMPVSRCRNLNTPQEFEDHAK